MKYMYYTEVFDTSSWFPEYGENFIKYYTIANKLFIEVFYDNVNDKTNNEYPFAKRSYIFDNIYSFYQGKWSIKGGGVLPMRAEPVYSMSVLDFILNKFFGHGYLTRGSLNSPILSNLSELHNSLLVKEWKKFYEKKHPHTRDLIHLKSKKINDLHHYVYFFQDSDIMIEVICSSVQLSEEELLKEIGDRQSE